MNISSIIKKYSRLKFFKSNSKMLQPAFINFNSISKIISEEVIILKMKLLILISVVASVQGCFSNLISGRPSANEETEEEAEAGLGENILDGISSVIDEAQVNYQNTYYCQSFYFINPIKNAVSNVFPSDDNQPSLIGDAVANVNSLVDGVQVFNVVLITWIS